MLIAVNVAVLRQAVGSGVMKGRLALFCSIRLDNAGGHSRCISDNAYKRLAGVSLSLIETWMRIRQRRVQSLSEAFKTKT